MAVQPREFWTDEQMLEVLAMRDADVLSARQIAARVGKSGNSIIGLCNRIDKAMSDDNGIGNGTLPARWWVRENG